MARTGMLSLPVFSSSIQVKSNLALDTMIGLVDITEDTFNKYSPIVT